MSKAQLMSPTRNSLGRILARTVSQYFEDTEHRREFEAWYEKTYGKQYVWKKGCRNNDTQPQTL